MRNFIISLLCISALVFTWGSFSAYSADITSKCITSAERLISDYIPEHEWHQAEMELAKLTSLWNKYQKTAYHFLDSKEINEIDGVLHKSSFYISARDVSNSTGEISYLMEKISNLHQSDRLTSKNIF